MSDSLPEDEGCDDDTLNVQQATVRLLAHLWESRERTAASIARQVPLVASSRRAVRWSPERRFMAPVRVWPESARPFAKAYPPNRVLNDLYAGSATEEIPNVTEALAEWDIALSDPITATTVDLKERRLAALSPAATDGNRDTWRKVESDCPPSTRSAQPLPGRNQRSARASRSRPVPRCAT